MPVPTVFADGECGVVALTAHEVSVEADGYVLLLTCSCGWREELPDMVLLVAEVARRAREHRESAVLQEDMFAHLEWGHVMRVQGSEEGLVTVCSCEVRWPVFGPAERSGRDDDYSDAEMDEVEGLG